MDILPLTPHPHLDPLPKHLSFHRPALAVLVQDAGGGQAVQHGLNGGAGVSEFDVLQSAAVHELHPLAELAFFKSVPVGHAEMFIQYFEGGNPVNAVDGGKEVVRILEMGLVLQKGGQVEVIL